jgi:hypothetical protein
LYALSNKDWFNSKTLLTANNERLESRPGIFHLFSFLSENSEEKHLTSVEDDAFRELGFAD